MVSNPNPVNELSSISKSRDNKKMVYGVSLNFSTLSNRFFNSANSAIFHFKKVGLSSKIVLNYKIVAFFYHFFSMWVFFHEHSQITGLPGKGEGI